MEVKRSSFRRIIFSGFTVVEILVVIGIIALLVGVIVPRALSIRTVARDTQRVSDLSIIQNALNLYFVDNKRYPATIPSGLSGPLVTYLKQIPADPRSGNGWSYRYVGIDTNGDPSTCESYHLGAKMENTGPRYAALRQDRDAGVSTICTGSVTDFDGINSNSSNCTVAASVSDTCFDLAP